MKRRIYLHKKILSVALVTGMLFGCMTTAYASKIEDAEEKRAEAQQKLDAVNDEIDEIHHAQNELQAEMDAYDEALMTVLTDLSLLEDDIVDKEAEIVQAEADLKEAENREAEQYEAMKLRIQYMYENSDTSIWSAMVGATELSDALNRAEYVNSVYEYDRDQLEEYQETVQQVSDLKTKLDNEMIEMEELQMNMEEQQSQLEVLIAESSAMMADFNTQLANASSLAKQYATTIKQQNQIIAAEEERIAREKAEAEAKAKAAAQAAAEAQAQAVANVANNHTANESSMQTNEENSNSTTGNNVGNEINSNAQTNNNDDAEETTSNHSSSDSSSGLTNNGLNPSYSTNVSGADVVNYAKQFVGNPYKFGGTSLTNGCDCSYFVMACFGQFGISLPRTSYSQRSSGQAVSYDSAKAGDIICYAGHVAIYMGDGKIVHAANSRLGICYGTATYRTIVSIRRVL